MKNISQLAKLARRIPRIVSHSLHKLRKPGKLSDAEAGACRSRIHGAMLARTLLDQEVQRRNIGGKPFRDATPHRLRRAPSLSLAAA